MLENLERETKHVERTNQELNEPSFSELCVNLKELWRSCLIQAEALLIMMCRSGRCLFVTFKSNKLSVKYCSYIFGQEILSINYSCTRWSIDIRLTNWLIDWLNLWLIYWLILLIIFPPRVSKAKLAHQDLEALLDHRLALMFSQYSLLYFSFEIRWKTLPFNITQICL